MCETHALLSLLRLTLLSCLEIDRLQCVPTSTRRFLTRQPIVGIEPTPTFSKDGVPSHFGTTTELICDTIFNLLRFRFSEVCTISGTPTLPYVQFFQSVGRLGVLRYIGRFSWDRTPFTRDRDGMTRVRTPLFPGFEPRNRTTSSRTNTNNASHIGTSVSKLTKRWAHNLSVWV